MAGVRDLADDPRELVPGDPGLIWRMADSYERIGTALEDIGLGFRTLDDGGWRGQAADAFHAHVEQQPRRFLAAADAFGTAAVALDTYAHALSWAQRQAAEAIALRARPVDTTEIAAVPALAEQAERAGVLSGPPDPGMPPRTRHTDAAALVERVRGQLEAVGREAARMLHAAGRLAPLPAPATPPTAAAPSVPETLKPLVLRVLSDAAAAAAHPDATIKQLLHHDVLRDDPAAWAAGVTVPERTRRPWLDQLSPRLMQHLFDGHVKRRTCGRGYRYLGYHHRADGVDNGPMRVVEIVAGPDVNGAYRAMVAGPLTDRGSEAKRSTFFPDAWPREEVLRAVRHAFGNRRFGDDIGSADPRKWRGAYRGMGIEGYVEHRFTEPAVDARIARPYHISTAYPVFGRGAGDGPAG